MKNQIYYYSTIVRLLQNLKTSLLKTFSNSNHKRKQFISKMKLFSTQKEMLFFETL